MVLVGMLKPPGEFECPLTDCWPVPHANPPVSSVFRCILLMVTWLRPFVLAIASLRLSPLNPFDFGLFNCGWTIWLGPFVLAVAGLWLGVMESSPGRLTFDMSPGAPRLSFLTGSPFLANVSHGVLSPAIGGIGAWSRLSPICIAEKVLPSPGVVRWGGHSGRCESNRSRSRHIVCVDAVESTTRSL